ncbi:DNA polymerase IV [Gammaproteobacteria bacterium]|nr:DNA polymerase IV [Gammaproteobacteria bacterium]
MHYICKECTFQYKEESHNDRCKRCNSPRLLKHPELHSLHIAHIDCDAFYASVEKRDNPGLKNKPVIVGGGKRGVVAACCYISRIKGIHSAMPMYKALEACPEATVISPNMEKYIQVGKEIKNLMRETTPLVESLSIDEAFLDLSGTQRLHNGSPAKTLIRLIQRIESEVEITSSVGLSYNKFLSKTASDMDKPRGFSIIGKKEALNFLDQRSVGSIWGVGKSMQHQLEKDGLMTINQLRKIPKHILLKKYGKTGKRLFYFARGEDNRTIQPNRKSKSISKETTFINNIKNLEQMLQLLWPLCETAVNQLRREERGGRTITLKLRTSNFKIITRSRTLKQPTQLAEVIYQEAKLLLIPMINGTAYRLIGIGIRQFSEATEADQADLLNNKVSNITHIENAMETVRKKFGQPAIKKGRAFLKH